MWARVGSGAGGTPCQPCTAPRGLFPIHRHPVSSHCAGAAGVGDRSAGQAMGTRQGPASPRVPSIPGESPTQTWSATRIVIGASRTLLSLSKYFPASSGRECLKERMHSAWRRTLKLTCEWGYTACSPGRSPWQELELHGVGGLGLDVACLRQELHVLPQLLAHFELQTQGRFRPAGHPGTPDSDAVRLRPRD